MIVLVIAPHPDDEVLGCGGAIAKHASLGDEVFVSIVTKGTAPMFPESLVEQTRDECRRADSYLGVKETIFLDFPAARLEEVPRHEFNDSFIRLVQRLKPEIVYIPHRGDMQLDHKMVVDAAMVALRPKYDHVVKKIYAYETMSETGWDVPNTVNEFIPTCYVDISDWLKNKIEALGMFNTQIADFPNARSIEAVEALSKYRGATMGMKAAEAFVVVRDLR